jgi:hypothetical protein
VSARPYRLWYLTDYAWRSYGAYSSMANLERNVLRQLRLGQLWRHPGTGLLYLWPGQSPMGVAHVDKMGVQRIYEHGGKLVYGS